MFPDRSNSLTNRVRLGPSLCACAFMAHDFLWSTPVHATSAQGDIIQTDSVGSSLVTYDIDTKATKSIANVVSLSEYIGLHAYVADRVRLGVNLQFTERVWPAAQPSGKSGFERFAVLPQVGWNFYDPFFTALVLGVAPRTDGHQHLNLTVQGVLGIGASLSDRVRVSVAGNVPVTYYDRHTLGLTAIAGISFRL